MVLTILLGLWAILVIAPETPIARMLHRWTVAGPARLLARINRGHVLFLLLMLVLVAMVGYWLQVDGLRMLGMAAPEITAWAVMFDVATYLDVVTALAIAASAVRLRSARTYLLSRLPSRHRRPVRRARRTARRRTERTAAANDDGEGHGWRFAA